MNDNRHVNRHPADELADVRGKPKALEAREAELRDVLLRAPSVWLVTNMSPLSGRRPRPGSISLH
jgi:hypothetical protein